MIGFNPLECHSRENGNPELKNQYFWIPACAGMTNLKNTNLNFKKIKNLKKIQGNFSFFPNNGFNLDSNELKWWF